MGQSMTRTNILLLLFSLLFFTSIVGCKKNDDLNNQQQSPEYSPIKLESSSFRLGNLEKQVLDTFVLQFNKSITVDHIMFVEVKPVDKVTYHPPRIIKDGYKHQTFRVATNVLLYLNPGIDLNTILSYTHYLNQHRTAGKPMLYNRMFDIVSHAYCNALKTGELLVNPVTMYVHFNKNCGLSENEKKAAASKLNALRAKKQKLELILIAVEDLPNCGYELTRKNMIWLMGHDSNQGKKFMCAATVRKYFKEGMDVQEIRNQISVIDLDMAQYIENLRSLSSVH